MTTRRPARHHATADSTMLPPGVAAAVRARDSGLLLASLAPLVTAHADSLRGAHKFALYKIAEAELQDGAEARRWASELSKRGEPIAKQFAMHLVALHSAHARTEADAVVRVVQRGADDENWEVRETAGGVLARLLDEAPDTFGPVLKAWSRSPSANLRRAVVLALKYAVRSQPSKADDFLDVLEGLASDGDEYVRKNLGPFALGDGFLRAAPGPTLRRLDRWARSKDEWVVWNCVSAFTAASARKHAEEGVRILRIAAADGRPMVARAVVRALVNLAQGDRSKVVRAVSAWGEDPARRAAASAFQARVIGRSM